MVGILTVEILIYTYDKILGLDENYHAEINIYELAHKCKEWVLAKKYIIKIEHHYSNTHRILLMKREDCTWLEPWKTTFETEPEAIFKATSYIMEQLKQKD